MEIVIEKLFIADLEHCPTTFQLEFRKAYQQLKIVDKLTEVKGIYKIEKNLYKLVIGNSKIALRVDGKRLTIGMFLFNEYYNSH